MANCAFKKKNLCQNHKNGTHLSQKLTVSAAKVSVGNGLQILHIQYMFMSPTPRHCMLMRGESQCLRVAVHARRPLASSWPVLGDSLLQFSN